jgi:hypothetical protein
MLETIIARQAAARSGRRGKAKSEASPPEPRGAPMQELKLKEWGAAAFYTMEVR